MENTTNNNTVLRSENERINALKRYQILDTPSEYVFEQVVQLAVRMFDVPVALVSFIDGDDIFFKASAGIKGIKNVNRSFSLCPLTIQTTEILLVENALENPAVMSHPSVAGENGLRFYAGAPLITADGYPIGTVCVIDYQPREFSEKNRELLAGLANLLMYELEQRLTSIQKTVEFGNVAEKLAVANAEIQSANEELATSIELLQASNEQLEARVEERTTALSGKVKELADSEKNARNIVENAPFPIGIYTGKEMRVVLANQAILDIWGKGNDVIGKRYADILPELDNQDIFKQLDDVFTTGKTFVARNQQLTLVVDGVPQVFYFNYNFLALRNEEGEIYGVMNTGADVTDIMLAREEIENVARELAAMNEELAAANEEQTAANEELALINEKYKISQDELQLAINAASLATFDLDPVTGRFSGNDQLKTWFGLMPQDEIELHRATDVIAETDRPKVLAAIQQAMTYGSGGDYDTHYTIINPLNAEARIVRAKGKALFNEKQECVRLSGVLQDVTEQKKDEQRKNDFIGMVSHELKTPLTSLTAIIQVLHAKLKNHEDSFISGGLQKASLQVKKMSNLINGFLNISRLESGKIRLDKNNFNLRTVIENLISETNLMSPGHLIRLLPGEPVDVFADEEKIGSVISNLLSNAVKYSQKGTTIEINCTHLGNEVEVSVKDEGIGVKPEDAAHLFDRYYRVDNPNFSHVSGFGIGLYLSAEIVKQHGGRIWIESLPDAGSTFYFALPDTAKGTS